MSELQCPACGSDNTTRLALSVMRGTRQNILGTSLDQLAKQFGPPEKKPYRPIMLMFSLIWGAIEVRHGQPGFGTLLCVIYFGLAVRALWYNLKTFPGLLEAYKRRFLCERCGALFEIPDPQSEPESTRPTAKILYLVKDGLNTKA